MFPSFLVTSEFQMRLGTVMDGILEKLMPHEWEIKILNKETRKAKSWHLGEMMSSLSMTVSEIVICLHARVPCAARLR